jgi:hypothetical protein
LAQSGVRRKNICNAFLKSRNCATFIQSPAWRVRDAEGEKAGGEKQASIIRPVSEIGDFFI